jgi:ABC-type transport system involved in multi-copper enzyme maturation permease subunit
MLGLALRAAGVFTGERERQTMDSLLTSDLTDDEIISGKLRGCLWSMRNAGTILGVMLALGILTGGLFPLFLFGVAMALAAHAAFAVNLGMYCSLVSRSTMRATLATVSIFLAVTLGHWIVYLVVTTLCHMAGSPDMASTLGEFHLYGLTPPVTQAGLIVTLSGATMKSFRELNLHGVLPALLGTGLYALLALLLGILVRVRFAKVTGRRG